MGWRWPWQRHRSGIVLRNVRLEGGGVGLRVGPGVSVDATGLDVVGNRVGVILEPGAKATLRRSIFEGNGVDIVRHARSELRLIDTYADRLIQLDAGFQAHARELKERGRMLRRAKSARARKRHAQRILRIAQILGAAEWAADGERLEELRTIIGALTRLAGWMGA